MTDMSAVPIPAELGEEDFQPVAHVLPAVYKRAAFLGWFFLAALFGLLLYEWLKPDPAWGAKTRLLGTACMLLGSFPAILYLFRGRFRTIPFFEGHCLFYVVCFGYAAFRPVVVGGRLATLGESDLQQGLAATFLCLVGLEIGFYLFGWALFRGIRPFSLHVPDMPKVTSIFLISAFSLMLFLGVLSQLGVGGLLQVTSSLWVFTVVLLSAGIYAGYFPRWAVHTFWFFFIPWMVLIGSGFLTNAILGGMIEFAIWQTLAALWARGRPSYVWLLLAVAIIFLLQPLKGFYRVFLWGGADNRSVIEKLVAWQDIMVAATPSYKDPETARFMREAAYARMNHLVVTSGVIRDTPEIEPFQLGKTYYPLFVKWIPRIIWPNKPVEKLGNEWARRYGYLNVNDYTTSFNLPWLPEMYLNFGWWGVIFIPLLLGILFRWAWQKFGRTPETVVDFAIGVTVLIPLVMVESHLSMKFGGLIVHAIGLFIVLSLIKYYLRLLSPTIRTLTHRPSR